jgi:RNA polymerase sigma factor (sigma-70 family)
MDPLADPWRRLIEGDRRSWDLAVTELFRRVRGFFLNKLSDANETDELTQRTFDRLQQVRGAYTGGGSPRSYVLGIAHFILLEFLRERYRDTGVPIEEVSIAAVDARPSSVLAARSEQRLVLEALRRLTLEHQIVLELYYWEDMSDPEIADVLQCNENTIRGRRTRARERMRQLLVELEQGERPGSTSMDLEDWARSVKDQFGVPSSPR